MRYRFVENARCPSCSFEGAVSSRDCLNCRRAIKMRAERFKGRLSLSGLMLLVAFCAVVFAAVKFSVIAGVVAFFCLAPATFSTIVDLSKKRFEIWDATLVLVERIAMSMTAGLISMGGGLGIIVALLVPLQMLWNGLEDWLPQRSLVLKDWIVVIIAGLGYLTPYTYLNILLYNGQEQSLSERERAKMRKSLNQKATQSRENDPVERMMP